ncbi:MAG: hypothetical protein ACK41O_25655 [Runella zeae]
MATHGFVKKTAEVPAKEIDKADKLKKRYFTKE